MKYMYICIIFVMICCTNQQNTITFSPLKTQQLNASDTLFEPFYGNWNCIVRDSMSGAPIEWHFAEQGAADKFRQELIKNNINDKINVFHTPMKW